MIVEQGTERPRLSKANALIGRVVQALDYRGLYQRSSGSDRPPELAPGFTRTETGMFAYLPFSPGNCRVGVSEWEQPPQPDTDQMPIDELRAAVRRVLGADVAISYPTGDGPIVRHRATGTNSRQADRYRAGRVFLAGDAAHVHSGIGAPGLNLGLQDVFNLGWKLAATVHGHGGDQLLDSYLVRPTGIRPNGTTPGPRIARPSQRPAPERPTSARPAYPPTVTGSPVGVRGEEGDGVPAD